MHAKCKDDSFLFVKSISYDAWGDDSDGKNKGAGVRWLEIRHRC